MYPILELNRRAVFSNGIGGYEFRHELAQWIGQNLVREPTVVLGAGNTYRAVFWSTEDATLFRLRWGYG